MYETFYNLQGRPFQLTPDPRFYFSSRTHKKAMAYLTYGLNQGEGFILVTGDIGTGKTTLVRHLFETLDRNDYTAAMIVSTQLSSDDLLRSVVASFGLDARAGDKGELLARLEQFLRSQFEMGRRAVLVVDEAQNLSNAALEELRMLSNFQEGDKALIQSFLVGQPEFRDRVFNAPDLEQLRQRIIATHHLDPMEEEEVATYIEHRLLMVGWDNDPTFTAEAVERIFDFSDGVPRKLNTICSRILLFGALEEVHDIDADVVDAVIEDMNMDANQGLGRGPTPLAQRNGDTVVTTGAGNVRAVEDQADTIKQMQERMNRLEDVIRNQDDTLRKLAELMTNLAGGGGSGSN